MKTSWTETQENEDYLTGNLAPAGHLLLSAELLVNPVRSVDLEFQQQTYDLVKLYGRKKLKQEIEGVHQKLFKDENHKSFREMILKFFKK